MRRLVVAAVLTSMSVAAHAADLPDLPILRGPVSEPVRPNWQGIYVGGQYAYSSHDFDFTKTGQGLQNYITRDSVLNAAVSKWELLGTQNYRWQGFGGFAGYNWQWEDAVIGLEANYTRFQSKLASSSAVFARAIVNPDGSNPPAGHTYTYDTTLTGSASAKINDLVTLRAKGGWDAGIFMPYLFGGLAVATVDISRSALVTGTRYDDYDVSVSSVDPVTLASITNTVHRQDASPYTPAGKSESQKNLLTFGFSAGLGTEILLTQNIFARVEYEYVQLPLAKDTTIQLHTGKVGLGAKF